jgi:hypothetical protein
MKSLGGSEKMQIRHHEELIRIINRQDKCMSSDEQESLAEEWNVYKQTMSNACKVQRPTERPLLGAKHLGPFKTKEEATKAMCKDVDPDMTDTTRCWETLPKDAC